MKTFEECCNEVAKKTPYGDMWKFHFVSLNPEFFKEASQLYAKEVAIEAVKLAQSGKLTSYKMDASTINVNFKFEYTEQEILEKMKL